MSIPLQPVVRRRLVDAVILHLRQGITSGTLAPGSRIPPESELTGQLGVSRTTLREAVVVLSHDGLLDVRQGDGTYVAERPHARESLQDRVARTGALDAHEVRRSLELEAARLAAARRTERDVETLRQLLADRAAAWRTGSIVQAVDADVAFRVAVAVASRNSVLADLYSAFAQVLRTALISLGRRGGGAGTPTADSTDFHEALADAIEARNAGAAVRASARLLDVEAERLPGQAGIEPTMASATPSVARRGPRAKHADRRA